MEKNKVIETIDINPSGLKTLWETKEEINDLLENAYRELYKKLR